MKRIIALLLALLMIFALVACGEKKADSAPSDDTAVSDAPVAYAPVDGGERDPYILVYMCSSFGNVWCKNIETAMKALQEEYNYELYSTDSNYDNDLWMTNVETYCDQGIDGFVMNCDETLTQRTYEVTSEYGIPWLSESTAVRDNDGMLLTSGVELDAYQVGVDVGTWIVENYKEHFGVDKLENVGYISMYYSKVLSFNNRCAGAESVITKEFPDAQVFKPDLLAQGALSADAAYNEVSPILAANPDIDYWLITGVVDDWSLGATRAVEAMNLVEKTLITSAGGEALILEWDNGYDSDGKGCWKACCYYEAMDYVEYLIPGMIDILDGKTTVEDIWNEWDEEGSEYASVKVGGTNCTKDNYLDFIKMRY